MKYISYNEMKDFYTINEICRLFEMDKAELRRYAEKYHINPQEDQYGNWGFRKILVRKLHNYIYKEQRNISDVGSSPWNNKPSSSPWSNKPERKSNPWA